MARARHEPLTPEHVAEPEPPRPPTPRVPPGPELDASSPAAEPRRVLLGKAEPRGYGGPPRLSLEAAASFAVLVDTARARAAVEGRTLVYTVRWA